MCILLNLCDLKHREQDLLTRKDSRNSIDELNGIIIDDIIPLTRMILIEDLQMLLAPTVRCCSIIQFEKILVFRRKNK